MIADFEVCCSDCPPKDCPTDKTRCDECPRRKPSRQAVSDTILSALLDGVMWQESLADATRCDGSSHKAALDQAAHYRKLLAKRYGMKIDAMGEINVG